MIAYLKGTILSKKPKYLILITDKIGYQVFVNEKTLVKAKEGEELELYCYQYVSENAQELYGFMTLPELELFKNLIAISGATANRFRHRSQNRRKNRHGTEKQN